MNLYLIEQNTNNGYETYDSAVVVAKSVDQAKLIHPETGMDKIKKYNYEAKTSTLIDWWIEEPDSWVKVCNVKATLIGNDVNNRPAGEVICASFNAG